MLRSIKDIQEYKIKAKDGKIGDAYSFLFDDMTWFIRSIVVDIGGWLQDNKVLISPKMIEKADGMYKILHLNLTKEEIRNSPDLDTSKPVSRKKELEMSTTADTESNLSGEIKTIEDDQSPLSSIKLIKKMEIDDERLNIPHIRSTKELINYHIKANDGEMGQVEDFIIDDKFNWKIRYLVINLGNWLTGKKVLISPQWIEYIIWDEKKIYINVEKEKILNSPEYDPSDIVNIEYEAVLYDYYGRPKYWETE